VDPQNIIQEKDETHHQAVVQVTVIGPDLGMSAVLQPSQAPLSTRDTLRVDVTVKNQGPMKAFFPQGSYFIYYGAQGFTMNKLILPNSLDLAAGQEYRTTLLVLPFTPNAGAYTMLVSLDPTNSMGDPNQANNRVAFPFSLANPRITDAKPVTPAGPSVVTKPAPTGTRSGVVPPKTSIPPVKTPDLVR
jgi:subtilase family serine protease